MSDAIWLLHGVLMSRSAHAGLLKGELGAICSAAPRSLLDKAQAGLLRDLALRHHERLSVVARRTDIAPARFGTAFPSREALRSHLASSGPVWREALGRVRGGVEFSLGFSLPVETVSGDPEAAEGYLRRRKDAMEAKQAIADRVRETGERIASTLSRLAMAAMPPRLGKGGALGEITVLVARAEANAFVERVASIGHGLSARPSITVKGPWPPYSFATVGD